MITLEKRKCWLLEKPELYTFKSIIDARGNLSFMEVSKDIPFEIRRVYWLYEVPEKQIRGGHAHKTSHQVIICTKGYIGVSLESKEGEVIDFSLDTPDKGLYIPPMWWGKMIFHQQATMIGLASDEFSEEDYIRNREDF